MYSPHFLHQYPRFKCVKAGTVLLDKHGVSINTSHKAALKPNKLCMFYCNNRSTKLNNIKGEPLICDTISSVISHSETFSRPGNMGAFRPNNLCKFHCYESTKLHNSKGEPLKCNIIDSAIPFIKSSSSPIKNSSYYCRNEVTKLFNKWGMALKPDIISSFSAVSEHTECTLLNRHQNGKLKLGLCNAQSLNNKTQAITNFITEHSIDAMFITETWVKSSDDVTIGELECQGNFRFVTSPREGRSGGGVGCLHRPQVQVSKIVSQAYSSFEHMVIKLKAESYESVIILIYRPEPTHNNPYSKAYFFTELNELISEHQGTKHDLIILGDFNIHVNKGTDTMSAKLQDTLEIFDLKQLVNEPTHIAGNTLDLVITRHDNCNITSCKVDELLSDHHVILLDLEKDKPKCPKKLIKFRKTRKINIEKYRKDLSAFLNNHIEACRHDANMLDSLITVYDNSVEVLDKHAPLLERMITLREPTPWNTEDIRDAKRAKRKAERKWKQTRNTINLIVYKKERNALNQLLQKLKRDELSKRVQDLKGNSKALFKVINQSLNRKQSLPLPHITPDTELTHKFANFFEAKIDRIRSKLDGTNTDQIPIPYTFHGNRLVEFAMVNQDQIRKIITKMATKHSKLDRTPTWLIKECLPEYLPIITDIVNESLKTGIMPDSLKHAIINPLLKKTGLELNKENYRPVSNLKFLSKVVESAIIDQFNRHLTANNLNDPKQSAYKAYHSTETLLTKIHNDIMLNGNDGNITMIVLLDLSAAFDTIDHGILLNRLENMYGIGGTALKWFRSYISNRTQSVLINNTSSTEKHLKYGVPQGSKLGPVLFNAYIAPVSDVAKENNVSDEKYADDQQLILAFKPNSTDALNTKHKMEKCIMDIRSFLNRNKLCNNSEKTECILIGHRQQLGKINIQSLKVDNATIHISDHVKNLGVLFDRHMNMDKQVNKICKNAYMNIRNISKIRSSLNKDCTKIIVSSLITPHFDYCNGMLCGTSERNLNKLQTAQNAAVRLIEKLKKRDHITEKRKQLHWLPIRARIEYKLISLAWKINNKCAPKYLLDLLANKSNVRNLRGDNTGLLAIPNTRINNKWGSRAFSMSGPTLWNQLPGHIRLIENQNTFKKQLKTFLFKKFY